MCCVFIHAVSISGLILLRGFILPHFHLVSFSFCLKDFLNISCNEGLLMVSYFSFFRCEKKIFMLPLLSLFLKWPSFVSCSGMSRLLDFKKLLW